MKIEYRNVEELKPYENNPRDNSYSVGFVSNSIKSFGFWSPIVLDKNDVIVAGHTRYEAAMKVGLKKVPTVKADDLTEDEAKAFRLADNKTAELSEWDFEKLNEELSDCDMFDMTDFGFSVEQTTAVSVTEEDEDEEPEEKKKVFCPRCGHEVE